MRCPSCKKEFHPQPDTLKAYWADDDENSKAAMAFLTQQCPSCYDVIVIRQDGDGKTLGVGGQIYMNDVSEEEVIYPSEDEFIVPPEVPEEYEVDLTEAHAAMQYSAKASAALSRRLLQKTLRERLNIRKRDLSLEIDEFIRSANAPAYLTGAVDAVRNIGNFAAHPIKHTNTGEIVDVEPGEAEWLLEVLESLFDFVFVQPARLEQRRTSLNAKLSELGKPGLKG